MKLYQIILAGIFLTMLFTGMGKAQEWNATFFNNTVFQCYQETANASTIGDGNCGLDYSGVYSSSGLWNYSSYYKGTIDGNWGTYGADGAAGLTSYGYINYTKPLNALNSSLWQVKAFGNTGTRNLTILNSCWNYNNSKLSLQYESWHWGAMAYNKWYCYDGTWQLLYESDQGATKSGIYEEAMIWNISGAYQNYNVTLNLTSPLNNSLLSNSTNNFTIFYNDSQGIANMTLNITYLNGTLVNSTTSTFGAGFFSGIWGTVVSLVNGVYTWFYTVIDYAGNVFTTESYTITINATSNITLLPIADQPYKISGTNQTLNWTVTGTNAISSCWYSNNGVANISITCSANSTNVLITANTNNLIFYVNDTLGNVFNRNLIWHYTILQNNVTYNNPVYETSTQPFIFNITTFGNPNIVVNLVYNNTIYPTTESIYGDQRIYTSTVSIPAINSIQVNKTFHWSMAGDINENTGNYNQSINQIIVNTTAGCSYLIANFTDYDEETLLRINPFAFQSTFFYWLGSGATKAVIFGNSSINELNLCFNLANTTLYADGIIEYGDNYNQYVTRNYYYVNASFNSNSSQAVKLYSLNKSAPATSFVLQVYSEDSTPAKDIYISTLRYYPGENLYRLVQMAKTSDAGISVGFFRTEIPDYKFILVRDSQVVLTTSDQKVVPLTTPYTITFYLGNNIGSAWSPFENRSNFQYSLTYNDTSNMVYYNYIDTSGALNHVRLVVSKNNYTGTSPLVCNINSTAAAGTIQCNLTGFDGDYTAKAYISRSPEWLVSLISITINGIQKYAGSLGIIIGWLILVACAFVMIPNPTAGIVMINLALWMNNLLGFFDIGWPMMCGITFMSIIIAWELNT